MKEDKNKPKKTFKQIATHDEMMAKPRKRRTNSKKN